VVSCKPTRETSRETKPFNTLVLDFQLLELEKINFYCLRQWYVVMAALKALKNVKNVWNYSK
jgi:hypothetical protein